MLAVDLGETGQLVSLTWAAGVGMNRGYPNRTVLWLTSTSRSCTSSSRFRSESGRQTYIIKARRMTSGLVRKYRKGLRWVMPGRVAAPCPAQVRFP